jgi:hypothetical protein
MYSALATGFPKVFLKIVRSGTGLDDNLKVYHQQTVRGSMLKG